MQTHLKYTLSALCVSFLVLTSCSKEDSNLEPVNGSGETSILFDAKLGDRDFVLGKDVDFGGYRVNFSRFRYWVSNIVLVKSDGSEYELKDSYFLIEENAEIPVQGGSYNKVYPANKREEVRLAGVPVGEYSTVRFAIGVDEKYNDNLALSAGELSALNGMASDSWMWFTSYIFTTIGGRIYANDADTEGKFLQLETGSNDRFQEIALNLDLPLMVSPDRSATLHLNVDLNQLVRGIDIWTNNTIGSGQPGLMQQITDNFASGTITVQ